MDLRIFLHLPFPIEMVLPEGGYIQVGLVITMAVQAFESMGARVSFFCFESQRVDLIVCFAAPPKFSVIL